jgi:pimeloyl-ACP methyl ester carboxylesterase
MLQLLGSAPCDVAGFSFGGLVAGLMAAQMPLRVRRLVLVGAPGMGVGSGKRVPLQAWRHLEAQDARNAVHHSNLATLMLLHPESIDELAVAIQAANAVRDRMTRRRLALTDALAQALQTVDCPVHAIYGAGDAIYSGRTAELSAVLHTVPRLQSLSFIPDAGHWVQYERAVPFNAELAGILGSG